MIRKILQSAIVVAGGLALGGCQLDQAKTTAPVVKPPAADYQAPVAASPPATNIRGICYTPADLATYRARMLQQEMVVATLQCQNPGGSRAYERQYGDFLAKFQSDLTANSRSLSQLGGRKRFNVDVLFTEFANRTAQRAPVDKEFCSRFKRSFDWALSAQVTTIAQVPPPYDLGPEMNVFACPSP